MLGLGQSIVSSAANAMRQSPFELQVLLDAKVDASLITTDFPLLTGDLITWEDQKNNFDAAQSVSASRLTVGTVFGEQGAQVDVVDDFMTIPFFYDWTNLPFTILVVATRLASTGFKGIITNRNPNGSGSWFTMAQQDTSNMRVERTGGNTALNFNFDAKSQPPQIYEYNHNPTAGRDQVYRNGILESDVATLSNIGDITKILRIGTHTFNIRSWDGFLHQVEIWTGLFSPAFRASRNTELNLKWQQ